MQALNSARDSARAVRDEASRHITTSPQLDSVAPYSTFVSLLCVLLVGISLDGHEWLRGTAMQDGYPLDAVVSLGNVRFAEPLPNGKIGTRFGKPESLKKKCVDRHAPMPLLRVPTQQTDQAIWCALNAAGSKAETFLWLGYLPLLVAAALSGLLWLSNSFRVAKNARHALWAAGITDGVYSAIVIMCWLVSWLLLFASLCSYGYAAPSSLGWGNITLELSFGTMQLTFVLMTITVAALLGKIFSLWDDEVLRDVLNDFVQSSRSRKAVYALLCAQLLLLLACAVRAIEWQALVLLFGLYYLVADKSNFLMVYLSLSVLSLLVDVYRLGAMPEWGHMTGAQGFADGCYVLFAMLKPAAMGGMLLVWRLEAAKRTDSNAQDVTPRGSRDPTFSDNF